MDRRERDNLDRWLTREQPEPEVTFTDVTEPEDGAHITVWRCDLCRETFMVIPNTAHDPLRKHPDQCEGPPDVAG